MKALSHDILGRCKEVKDFTIKDKLMDE